MASPNGATWADQYLWLPLPELSGSKASFLELSEPLGFLIHLENKRDNKSFENLLHEWLR